MALHHNVRVPVPAKRIFKRKQNECVYIYYYTSFFRKENGKTSNTSVTIGKQDPDDKGMMIPNDHYYEYFDHSADIPYVGNTIQEDELSAGYSIALSKAASELGLEDFLHDSFGPLASEILTTAGYCILNGAVMSDIDRYTDRHYDIFNGGSIIGQRVSDLFKDISVEDQKDFFRSWIEKCAANQCIVYDVTSVSTWSKEIPEAEFGYNRDKKDLRQINLGLFSGEKTKLPVYYECYDGSLTDKVNMIPVMKNALDLGIDELHIVMDGGFFDETRLKELYDSGITFTVGMPTYLDLSKQLLDLHRNEVFSITNCTSFESNYAKVYDLTINGMPGQVMIGFNVKTMDLMMETLKKDIVKREAELEEKVYKKYSTVISKKGYTDLFEITEDAEKGYTFKRNEQRIQEMAKNYGYFLIFSTDLEATAEDILGYYREKDTDEKMFYNLKDSMEFHTLHTHQQKTTDGKIFTLFIALILRSWMQQKLKHYMDVHHLTFRRCMQTLEDMEIVQYDGQSPRLKKELTKLQKELFTELGIDVGKILEYL